MLSFESELRLLTWLVMVFTVRLSLAEDQPESSSRVLRCFLLEGLQRNSTRRMIPMLQLIKSRTRKTGWFDFGLSYQPTIKEVLWGRK